MEYREITIDGSGLTELLESVLIKGVSFRFKARGYSMYPFIKDGDTITISPLNGATVRIGDVIAFADREADKLIVHRIIDKKIKKENLYFFMKGDNTAFRSFESSPRENILGRVTKIERGGKSIRLSLGLGRVIIAFLSKNGILYFVFWYWKLLLFFVRMIRKAS